MIMIMMMVVPMVDKDGGAAPINQVCLVGVSTSWQVACRPILKTQKTGNDDMLRLLLMMMVMVIKMKINLTMMKKSGY